jgi:predicted Zn-dependent protease
MILAALTSLPVAGCSKNMVFISREQEIQMGNEAAPQFEEEFGGSVPDRQLQDYVSRVGTSVAQTSGRDMPYEFTLVRSDVPNAFALPGGKIFLTAGLMQLMNNEREMAAVLAHEVAHVAQQHNVRQMQAQMGWELMSQILGELAGEQSGQAASTATKIVGGMTSLKYSRDYEYEADGYGIQYMSSAGYNPWGMVELLTTLKNLHDREPSRLENMFQTHPLTSERIAEAIERIQEEHPRASRQELDPDQARFRQMRTRLLKVMGW